MANGRVDTARMEVKCCRAGYEAVEAWRSGGAALRGRLRFAGRMARLPKPITYKMIDPAVKVRAMLARWERKQKTANTKVKKYLRQLKALETKQRKAAEG